MTKRPFHIANVCFTGRSGLTDYTLSLARALAAHCKSTIVTARDYAYPNVHFDGEVVRPFRRSRHYPLDLLRFFLWSIRTKPDVVLFQGPLKLPVIDGMIARLLRRTRIRVATTVHDVLPHYPTVFSPLLFRYFYRSFDRIIVHSTAASDQLRALGATAPMLVVPHGVYDIYRLTGLSQQSARHRHQSLDEKDFVLLFFGHVDERKGIGELLKCLARPDLPSKLRLIIAGRCEITNSSTQLRFHEAKADPRLIVIDRRIAFEEVESLFVACDAVVLPYLEGTTSGVLKLALAFAKPVIATDVGDIPETVTPDAGIVISHRTIQEDLPNAIWDMQKNYDSYQENWSAKAANYEWPSIATAYYEFLSDGLDSLTGRNDASAAFTK